ncbi:hypothetical protein BH20ACI1_BH20ACI1_23760 [soil metagenome]
METIEAIYENGVFRPETFITFQMTHLDLKCIFSLHSKNLSGE